MFRIKITVEKITPPMAAVPKMVGGHEPFELGVVSVAAEELNVARDRAVAGVYSCWGVTDAGPANTEAPEPCAVCSGYGCPDCRDEDGLVSTGSRMRKVYKALVSAGFTPEEITETMSAKPLAQLTFGTILAELIGRLDVMGADPPIGLNESWRATFAIVLRRYAKKLPEDLARSTRPDEQA